MVSAEMKQGEGRLQAQNVELHSSKGKSRSWNSSMFKTGYHVCLSVQTGDSCGKMSHQYGDTACLKKKKEKEEKDRDKGEGVKLMNKTAVTHIMSMYISY